MMLRDGYDHIEFGARLKTFRIARGISQQEVGDHVGVTFQQVQKWESGINRVDLVRAKKIADLFGIPVSALVDHEAAQQAGFVPPEAAILMRHFLRISSEKDRRTVVALAAYLSKTEEEIGEVAA